MAKKAKKVGKRMAMGGAADKGRGGAKPMRPGRGNEGMVPGKPDGSGVVGYKPPGGSVSRPDLSGAMPRPMPSPGPGMMMRNDKFLRPGTPKRPPMMRPEVMPGVGVAPMPRGGMRGGGLAKKGVGMALAKGGMVKGAGCAKRGVKKPEYK